MLFAFKNNKYIHGEEYRWHIGDPVPWDASETVESPNGFMIHADGDELYWIQTHFKNLPMTNGRVVIWQGEYARFIMRNMLLDLKPLGIV